MQSEFVSSLFEWVAAHPGWMSTVIFLTAMAERVAVLEQRVATVEREQGAASDALWRRMLEKNVPAGFRP